MPHDGGMPFAPLVLPVLAAAVPAQAIAFARRLGWDWGTLLGIVLLGIVISAVVAPTLKADPFKRMWMVLLVCSVNVGNMALQSHSVDGLSLIGNIILLHVLWDEQGPGLKKRLGEGWTKALHRFARPVMGGSSPVS